MNKSKRQQRLDRKRQEKRRGQMRWVAIISVAAVGLAAMLIFASQVRAPDIDHDYSQKNGTFLGDPNALVTVIEYGDFQCSHCRNFYATTEGDLIDTYVTTGQVLYEYRPLNFLGPESTLSAEASLCAADQNMFWEYHDVVFANFSTGNTGGYAESRLVEFASTLNMDVDAFSACLAGGEKSEALAEINVGADAAGVGGTPAFLINGKLRSGNIPFADLSAEIEAALNALGAN